MGHHSFYLCLNVLRARGQDRHQQSLLLYHARTDRRVSSLCPIVLINNHMLHHVLIRTKTRGASHLSLPLYHMFYDATALFPSPCLFRRQEVPNLSLIHRDPRTKRVCRDPANDMAVLSYFASPDQHDLIRESVLRQFQSTGSLRLRYIYEDHNGLVTFTLGKPRPVWLPGCCIYLEIPGPPMPRPLLNDRWKVINMALRHMAVKSITRE